MAKIFFSSEWIKENVIVPDKHEWYDDAATGYGNFRKIVRSWLISNGHEITKYPDNADVEILVGDVGVKSDPHIYPSIIFTMFEIDRFPPHWIPGLPNWDFVALPSRWCVECFSKQFVDTGLDDRTDRLRYVPIGINPLNFPYMDRPDRSTWTIVVQGVELKDRKGLMYLHSVMQKYRLPENIRVWLKLLPVGKDGVIGANQDQVVGRLRICASMLDTKQFQDFLYECDYSINPTSGEGFGLIPLEHLSTGLGVSVTPYSGVMEYYTDRFFRPISFGFEPGTHLKSKVAKPKVESIYEEIMWSYRNREKVREIGKEGSKWVQENWTANKMTENMNKLLEEALKIERRVNKNRKPIFVRYEETNTFLREKPPNAISHPTI